MKIKLQDLDPIDMVPYLIVPTKSRTFYGSPMLHEVALPILKGAIEGLSNIDLDALIVASDLQGVVRENERYALLGEVLPFHLRMLIEEELPNLNPDRIGVLLCGDMYARTDKRGGSGDVREVWRCFNDEFKFVVGVAGNHDEFGDAQDLKTFKKIKNIHLLDNEIREVNGLRFGGIGGIIGNPKKLNRVERGTYLSNLTSILRRQPHFTLLHQCPSNQNPNLLGDPDIQDVVGNAPKNTLLCGHCHWKIPLVDKPQQSQILNADGRCVILEIEK